MGIYEKLGVRTIINAAGTVTRSGGSLMAPEVLQIMQEASSRFCLLDELHEKVGERIARMLDVEAAYVTASASECPPLSTLTHFWKAGVDLAIFSGGKSIMGPQSTGLVTGRRDLIAACAANGNPFATVGRPAKVSREEVTVRA